MYLEPEIRQTEIRQPEIKQPETRRPENIYINGSPNYSVQPLAQSHYYAEDASYKARSNYSTEQPRSAKALSSYSTEQAAAIKAPTYYYPEELMSTKSPSNHYSEQPKATKNYYQDSRSTALKSNPYVQYVPMTPQYIPKSYQNVNIIFFIYY